MGLWLKYTVLFSDFQPSTQNDASIFLDLVPPGSFIQNIKVRANTKYVGSGITACDVKAHFIGSLYNLEHTLDVLNHPFVLPAPPIPQSRTVSLTDTTKKLIKVSVKTTGANINALSGGACDIYFQLNEITYPYKLDLIFKQPDLVYSFKQLLSNVAGNMFYVIRSSDLAQKWFQYVDGHINNAGIIAWLAGATAYFRNLYNQVDHIKLLNRGGVGFTPIYDPVTSLLTFDGINDRLFLSTLATYTDFFVSVRSSVHNNQIVGHTGTINSAISRTATTVFWRSLLTQKTFTINSAGFLRTFIMSNNYNISAYVDNIEASNSPFVAGVSNFEINQVGARAGANFFNGTFDELITYNSALSNSEKLLINSI